MGCESCGYTGIGQEYEPEAGFVDIPCLECHGQDGDEPAWVTGAHDAATQAEIEEAWRQYAKEVNDG